MRNILYFVGAGLTKSLELPSKPVPLMWDYISVMADYLYDDVILMALAKLEINDCYTWKDPDAKTLAERLIRERSQKNREAFKRALKNKPSESIEDLLRDSDEEASIRFLYAINRLFYLINWDVNWCPLEKFLTRQLQLEETCHAFVSFNYDLILDRAVRKVAAGQWDICIDYGFKIPYCTYSDPPDAVGGGVLPTVDACELCPSGFSSGRLKIFKPHGSVNWLLPLKIRYQSSSSGMEYEDEPVIIPLSDTDGLRHCESSKNSFQYVSFPPGGLAKDVLPCIIPPTSAKQSNLSFINHTRSQVQEAIRDANEVYVLGWSMPT